MTEGDAGATDRPSVRVVEQRVRNRVIEYLELTASFEAQQQYEREVPIAHVPYEVINQWEDWVWKDPRVDADISSVYSGPEVEALCRVQEALDVAASAVPDDYPSLSEVQALPAWHLLRSTAHAALNVFMKRGKFPEDHEVA